MSCLKRWHTPLSSLQNNGRFWPLAIRPVACAHPEGCWKAYVACVRYLRCYASQWSDTSLNQGSSNSLDLEHDTTSRCLHLDHGVNLQGIKVKVLNSPEAQLGSCTSSYQVQDPSRVTRNGAIFETGGWRKLCEDGKLEEAFEAVHLLAQQGTFIPNSMLYSLIKSCIARRDLVVGRQLHSLLTKRKGNALDSFFGNHIIRLYASQGSLIDANHVFGELRERDTHVWASIISANSGHGRPEQAIELYNQMKQSTVKPNDYVFVAVLKACANAGDLASGRMVHADVVRHGFVSNVFVGSTLVDMYAKCRSLVDARNVFDGLSTKNVVTWSAMIAGYAQQGLGQDALDLYAAMQEDGMMPANVITFVSILQACGTVGAIQEGKMVHTQIMERALEANPYVASTLVDMYGKCGRLEDAHRLFARLPAKDVVTWTALIAGYGKHNDGRMAMQCFQEMQQGGVQPTAATFACLLVACSHVRMLNEGQQYFRLMKEKYSIEPTLEHYNIMVDLLGRSGHLDDAEDMLNTMPFGGDSIGWMSLLSACREYGDVSRGSLCFDRLLQLDSENPSSYVLMSSIYADAGRWDDVDNIESLRRCAGIHRKAAKALIEVNQKVHEFTVGEKRDDVALKLRSLNARMKEGGYIPQTDKVMRLHSDQEKEDALCGHAEKLALAYGLLNTSEGTTLLITKNLRMCGDCHSGTKIISNIERREIIVRDAHHVHHFKNGSCSCGDYS